MLLEEPDEFVRIHVYLTKQTFYNQNKGSFMDFQNVEA